MSVSKTIKITVRIIFYSLFALFLLYLGLFNGYTIKFLVFPYISSHTDYKVSADSIEISPFTFEFYLSNLKIRNAASKFEADIELLDCDIGLFECLKKSITFDYVLIKNTRIRLSVDDKKLKEEIVTFFTSKEKQNNSLDKVRFDIKKIVFDNVNIELSKTSEESKRASQLQLNKISLSGKNISTGKSGEIILEAESNLFIKGKMDQGITNKFFIVYKQHFNQFNYLDFFAFNIKFLYSDNNRADIFGYFYMLPDKDKTMETPFIFGAKINQIELLPLYRFFIDNSYSASDGILKDGRVLFFGKNLYDLQSSNIKYIMTVDIEDVTIPVFRNNIVFTMLLLPIEILANINSYVGTTFASLFYSDISADASDFLTNIGSSVFSRVISEISYSENKTFTIYMFYMKGQPPCTIDDFYMKGKAELDGQIDLQSSITLSGVSMPLNITGTIKKPHASKVLAVARIFTYNTTLLLENIFQDKDKIETERRDELKYFYDNFYPFSSKQKREVEFNINNISIENMPALIKNLNSIATEAYGFHIL
ncbi:MAG TPA: hypothetical protein DD381_05955 [Lentisphaeria bacterium]|nr:MAG: hypothetical protein A2X47_14150 [Lentisphaerae bacterium GWF2_38_69]HBM15869.1 hypothetical protein [Lentisphaeria bacterium]